MKTAALLAAMTHRAPTAPGRADIGFDGSAFFVIPPPPEPKPES
jgi:hypothetical protein